MMLLHMREFNKIYPEWGEIDTNLHLKLLLDSQLRQQLALDLHQYIGKLTASDSCYFCELGHAVYWFRKAEYLTYLPYESYKLR